MAIKIKDRPGRHDREPDPSKVRIGVGVHDTASAVRNLAHGVHVYEDCAVGKIRVIAKPSASATHRRLEDRVETFASPLD